MLQKHELVNFYNLVERRVHHEKSVQNLSYPHRSYFKLYDKILLPHYLQMSSLYEMLLIMTMQKLRYIYKTKKLYGSVLTNMVI